MGKVIKKIIVMMTIGIVLTSSGAAYGAEKNEVNNLLKRVEAYAPTGDFGNLVRSIQLEIKEASKLNLQAKDFHIEFISETDGTENITSQEIKEIKIKDYIATLFFDEFSYNQNFRIVYDNNEELSIYKKDINFNLGDTDKFEKRIYDGTYTSETLNYRLFNPKTTEKVPLILILHGGGEVGSDNEIQLTANDMVTSFASDEVQKRHEAFVLAPQLPAELKINVDTTGTLGWNEPKVRASIIEIIKELEKEYTNIDQSRIYVAGCSMGAMGTWGLITNYTDIFAAAMPVCGQGDISMMEKVKDFPIWAFHASDDPVVPMYGQKDQYKYNNNIIGTKTLVYRLRKLGSNVKFTEYTTQDMLNAKVPVDTNSVYYHFSWIPAFNNGEAIDWLFSQKK